jgi:hypothetical protein
MNPTKFLAPAIQFYFLYNCIQESQTLFEIRATKDAINDCTCYFAKYLGELAMFKEVEILSKQYSEVE